jgi:hypothetical protein
MKQTGKKVTLGIAFAALLTLAAMILLAGCAQQQAAAPEAESTAGNTASTAVSKDNPLVVDKDAKTVKIYTELNAKYVVDPTRHGVVFKDGKNGDKAVFRAYANQNDFYTALVDIGAKPGNNLDLTTAGKSVEGDQLDVTITWGSAGKEIPFNDAIIDTQGQAPAYRFGGNEDRAKEFLTGCILCLDSCPVGITSNSAYAQGSFDGKKVEFRGNKDVLPADGTPVTVTFKL